MAISRLNAEAKAALRWADISQAAWAREHFDSNGWGGDACGCPDDRCIGYHHDERDECGCLTVLIEQYWRDHRQVAR